MYVPPASRTVTRAPVLLALLLLLPAPAQAGPRDDGVRVRDGGLARTFEVALDEVRVARPGLQQGETITPAADFQALRATAARRQRAAGEEVELVLYEKNRPRTEFSRRYLTRRVLAVLGSGAPAASKLAARCGAAAFEPAPLLAGAWFFAATDSAGALDLADALRAVPGVIYAEPQLARQRQKRSLPNDPLFTNQWHLRNTGQNGATAGIDVNVSNVWVTRRGEGITIGIVDDGLQYTHPDLSNNYNKVIDYDFNGQDGDPAPVLTNDLHGTACAGVAAGYGSNGVGVAGAAYRANLVGLRLIGAPNTDADEAAAMAHSNDLIQIKNSSWGPSDDGITLEGPDLLTQEALRQGVEQGRGGRGTLYVWAGGNGGGTNEMDNANKDGYANSIYTIAVGAINDLGQRSAYSETGSCLVVCAPSDDYPTRQGITTADLTGNDGYNYAALGTNDLSDRSYTKWFGGTSSASPLLAGVAALMLQANTNLSWRDVQEILILTATKNHTASTDWATNAAGYHFSHAYGAGLVNARLAVNVATAWPSNLGTHTSFALAQTNLAVAIPDNNTNGVVRTFNLTNVGLRVEHVTVQVDIEHTFRGDLDLLLTSPSGMRSSLVGTSLDFLAGYRNWTFMTVRDWGEPAGGTWSLRVADRFGGDTGVLRRAVLTVYGTATNGALPLPQVEARVVDDSLGNQNGAIDPGEPIEESIVVRNLAGTTTNLAGILTTTTPGVTLLVATSAYPNADTQQRVTNSVPFRYRLAKTVACGTNLDFRLRLFYHGVVQTTDFTHVVGSTVSNSAVTNTFEFSALPRNLEDGTNVFATNVISQAGSPTVDDLDVGLRINHTAVGDLHITLIHPDGTEVLLSANNGETGTNFGTGASCGAAVRTVLDDEAATNLYDGTAPFAGRFKPDSYLSAVDGKPLNGTWRMKLTDIYSLDTGTLLCAHLQAVYHSNSTSCALFNTAPVASNQAATAQQDQGTNLVLAGSDADGEAIYFVIVDAPAHGMVTGLVAATGALTYTPTNGYCGTDTFTFVTWDTYTNSASATVTVAVACSDPDTDDDGMPDAWENAAFGDLSTAGTHSDYDTDGFIDLHEYLAGTQPTNAGSLLVATLLTNETPETVVIQWQSASNKQYSVYGVSELITDYWLLVTSGLPATPPLNLYTDAAATNAAQLYRIELDTP